jgi:hypothetical protein
MKSHLVDLLCFSVLGLAPAVAQQPPYPFGDPKLPAESRIDNLLSLMTTSTRRSTAWAPAPASRASASPTSAAPKAFTASCSANARGKRQPITTTQFPQPPGMGETWDPDMVRQAAAVEGYEARYITQTPKYDRQILMLWGPQSDLARDPRWGRSEEVYGEDPFFNGTMAVAFIKGLQGDDPEILAGRRAAQTLPRQQQRRPSQCSSSDFDERLFWEYYSVPFRMGFQEGGAKPSWPPTTPGTAPPWSSIPSSRASSATNGALTSSPAMAARSSSSSIRAISFPTRKLPSSPASKPASTSSSTGIQRRNQSRSQRRLHHRGRDRRPAPPQVPRHHQARPARPAGDGAILKDQRLARALEHRRKIAPSPNRSPSNPSSS